MRRFDQTRTPRAGGPHGCGWPAVGSRRRTTLSGGSRATWAPWRPSPGTARRWWRRAAQWPEAAGQDRSVGCHARRRRHLPVQPPGGEELGDESAARAVHGIPGTPPARPNPWRKPAVPAPGASWVSSSPARSVSRSGPRPPTSRAWSWLLARPGWPVPPWLSSRVRTSSNSPTPLSPGPPRTEPRPLERVADGVAGRLTPLARGDSGPEAPGLAVPVRAAAGGASGGLSSFR